MRQIPLFPKTLGMAPYSRSEKFLVVFIIMFFIIVGCAIIYKLSN